MSRDPSRLAGAPAGGPRDLVIQWWRWHGKPRIVNARQLANTRRASKRQATSGRGRPEIAARSDLKINALDVFSGPLH
ncbi:hypothetical protein RRG08_066238 [Elysia crispata]|uniref:Uncharacterized protein n=1 Tax=Elysia crispata TaxID=231223 RepID=A0AAE1EEN2_9GAST|nr:hypothetical protein RRG08_066238 [Elysia crispata]